MAKVRLAPVLRSAAGNSKQVDAQGGTVAEVLADLYARFPELKKQIQPEEELSRYINVYVNDQDIRYLNKLETTVSASDTVVLLPAMAGGCQE